MGRMAVASAGSVLGEQAFFDAKPRSTGVWPVDDCEIAARVRTSAHVDRRILATRLRTTTAKIVG